MKFKIFNKQGFGTQLICELAQLGNIMTAKFGRR
jgi:hypothetical protein